MSPNLSLATQAWRFVVTGGLSANEYLCACLASLSGLAVRRAGDPEATARGLARLVAGDDARAWPLPAVEVRLPTPDPALRLRYRRWRTDVDALDTGARGRAMLRLRAPAAPWCRGARTLR